MGPFQRGSVAETVRRLVLWARRAPKGLALVTYVSESARRRALDILAKDLASAGISHQEIRLPAGLSVAELTRELDFLLRAGPSAAISVLGWAEALDVERRKDRLDALRFLGAHRERVVKPGLRQIWWMPPDLAESLAFATPDLESWILVQLELVETSLPIESASDPFWSSRQYSPLVDAQRRSTALTEKYMKGLAAGDSLPELIDRYARPAIAALREAGAEKEANDLEVELDTLAYRGGRAFESPTTHAKDFLIRFAAADRAWAEWIGWMIENEGFSVVLWSWDFAPGANFLLEMQKAVQQARRTIVLISPDALASRNMRSEWSAALAADSRDAARRFLPIRVRETDIPEILGSIAFLDLVGLSEEEARLALLGAGATLRSLAGEPRSPEAHKSGRALAPPTFPRGRRSISNVPPRDPGFCGRNQILERAREYFRSDRAKSPAAVAVIGLDGLGKTSLVLEYAERYRSEYEVVWLVNAYSPDAARATLGHLAESLGLIDGERRETAAAARKALGWLADHDDWLLIYDDATDPGDLGDWLPRGPGHLAVTTRRRRWQTEAESIELPPLETRAAGQLLIDQSTDGDREAVEGLAGALAGRPLELRVAASLAHRLGSLAAVLSLICDPPDRPRGRNSVLAKVVASWLELLQEEPEAWRLLTLGSQFSSSSIPLGWLDESRAVTSRRSTDSKWDPREAAEVLAGCSLLMTQDNRATIHPLIQEAVRQALSQDQRAAALREAEGLVNRALDQAEWAGMPPPHHHLCHAETVALRLSESEDRRRDAAWAWMLERVGSLRAARGEGTTAVRLLDAAIRFWESLGDDRPEVVPALEARAAAHLAQGSPGSARHDLERGLQLSEALLGPDHPRTLHVRERLAQLLMTFLGEAHGAREHLEAVLENRRESLGPNHPWTADALHNLGLACMRLGDLAGARENLELALAIRREALGSEHPQVARSLIHLGTVAAEERGLEQALGLQREALEILEHTLGPEHPGLLTVLRNLAGSLRHTGRLAEAHGALERALHIAESNSGAGESEAMNLHYNLAQVAEELGESAKARTHYAAVYEALRAGSSTDDPSLREPAEKTGP